MSLNVVRLARKVFFVEAVRVTTDNMEELAAWCAGKIETTEPTNGGQPKRFIKVQVLGATHPRRTMAFAGDWVLNSGAGFKVYRNDPLFRDFERTAVRIPEPPDTIPMNATDTDMGPGVGEACA